MAVTRPVVRYWIPLTGYLALIFAVSSLPHPEAFAPTLVRSLSDKVTHALEYGILSVLCSRAFRWGLGGWAARHALLLSVLTCAAYGLSDEIHQAFVPSRDASGWDLLADTVGASSAAAFLYLITRGNDPGPKGRSRDRVPAVPYQA